MGLSSRVNSFSPSGVIRAHTVRRSLLSRERETKDRFSSRSSSRVISESRVTIRLLIYPHGSPSGAPRRIRSTLYCVDERSSAFNTCANRCDTASIVRIISRCATSSGEDPGFGLTSAWIVDFIYSPNNTPRNDYCQEECWNVNYRQKSSVLAVTWTIGRCTAIRLTIALAIGLW